jgi:hypothetical protein
MIETVQWRRWITKHHTRQSTRPRAQGDDFVLILMLSLSGLALSLFAIRQGWIGDGLILLLQ